MLTIMNEVPAGRQIAGLTATRQRTPITRRRPAIAFPARYKNRPTRIRMAIYRVWDRASEQGFAKSTVTLIQAILAAGVSADNPYEPIFAKKKRLAEMADISEASVYRGLAGLEDNGWIKRKKQTQLIDGTMDLTEITITQKLAIFLGLDDHNNNEQFTEDDQVQNTTAAKISGDSDSVTSVEVYINDLGITSNNQDEQIVECHSQQIATDSNNFSANCSITTREIHTSPIPEEEPAESPVMEASDEDLRDGLRDGLLMYNERVYPKASVNHQSTVHKFVRMDGRSVAVELVWLISEERLSYGQLFKLQKLAKQVQGQLLENFVTYRRDRIRELSTTNDCYRYLNNLIKQGLDAKYLCAQRAKQEHRSERRLQSMDAKRSRDAWCYAHHEKIFIDPRTETTYRINATHQLAEVGKNGIPGNRPNIKINGPFIKQIKAGRFIPFVPRNDYLSREESRSRVADLLRVVKPGRLTS